MLKPAILYKDEIEQKIQEQFYTEELFYFNGSRSQYAPDISDFQNGDETKYQFAILKSSGEVVGYLSYTIRRFDSQLYDVAAYDFEHTTDSKYAMTTALMYMAKQAEQEKIHRIELYCIDGNPAKIKYDLLMSHFDNYKLSIHDLQDVIKDRYGNFHNEYLYQLVRRTDDEIFDIETEKMKHQA
jgi:Tfp pilus tip-associated adhesin PilY1